MWGEVSSCKMDISLANARCRKDRWHIPWVDTAEQQRELQWESKRVLAFGYREPWMPPGGSENPGGIGITFPHPAFYRWANCTSDNLSKDTWVASLLGDSLMLFLLCSGLEPQVSIGRCQQPPYNNWRGSWDHPMTFKKILLIQTRKKKISRYSMLFIYLFW